MAEYLVRFDYERVRGWQVRLPKWHPRSAGTGRQYTEFFGDVRHGGGRGARRAALARRDELLAGVPDPAARPAANTVHKRSSCGLVGVTLAFRAGRPGEAAFAWRAVWQEPLPGSQRRRTRRRSFSVSVYGFAEALEKAIKERQKHTGLRFTREQRATALVLYRQVVCYCRTGKSPVLKPLPQQEPARWRQRRAA